MQEVRVVRLEPFPDLDDEVLFPRLGERKLGWLEKMQQKKGGARRTFAEGDVLYEHAVREAPFFVLLSGRVEFVDRKPGKDVHVAAAPAGTYIGDIAAFTGEPTISAAVATEPTEVLEFQREGLRAMVAGWPEFGESIFRTLQARRAWHEENGYGVLRLIAPQSSRRAFEVRDLLERNLLPVRWYDVDTRSRVRRDAQVAGDPARGNAGADPRAAGAAEPVPGPGGARAGAAGRGRRAALRPRRPRRRAGRAGGGGLRRLGGAADAGGRVLGAGRPGRHEHADRELPRLPDRDRRPRADHQGDAAGAPLRRDPLQLPPRGRTGRRAGRAGADRPRRRPARAGPLPGDGDRGALARATGRGRRPLPRRRRLPRGDAVRGRAGARQRRDRDRRRQLGRAGGDEPLAEGAQRAGDRARHRRSNRRCRATSWTGWNARRG